VYLQVKFKRENSVQTGPSKYFGEVNSILNRQCGWAKNDVSAYETVFGIDFDPIMPDTRDSTRRCTTIQERMDVAARIIFRAVVESLYDLTLNPSDPNDSVSMDLTLSQVGNVCDTTFSGCDFSQRFAEILEGPDVSSNSVQAQSTNDYEETSSDDEKPERKEQSFHIYCHSKDEILHHNENLGNHFFQQLQLDCDTDKQLAVVFFHRQLSQRNRQHAAIFCQLQHRRKGAGWGLYKL